MKNAAWALIAGLTLLGSGPAGATTEPAVLRGTVRDGRGDRLPGVRVQLFLDGYPLATSRSDSLGDYRLEFPWAVAADSTVIAWWTAEETDLVPAVAILRESRAAQRLGLWDTTIPRVAAPAESLHDPVLWRRGEAGRRAAADDSTESDVESKDQPDGAPAGN